MREEKNIAIGFIGKRVGVLLEILGRESEEDLCLTSGILLELHLILAHGGGHMNLLEIRLHSWVVS